MRIQYILSIIDIQSIAVAVTHQWVQAKVSTSYRSKSLTFFRKRRKIMIWFNTIKRKMMIYKVVIEFINRSRSGSLMNINVCFASLIGMILLLFISPYVNKINMNVRMYANEDNHSIQICACRTSRNFFFSN